MNSTGNIRLQIKKFIGAKREKVFQAWTDPAYMKQWFAPGDMTTPLAECEAKVGGAYKVQMKNSKSETFTTTGTYKEFIPNEKLVFSWGWDGPERVETLVTVEFVDKDHGTEVILTHERFADQASADHHAKGWEGCLASLAGRIGTIE
jgi:uncharacterized protein YndB with AHSA1/START domain